MQLQSLQVRRLSALALVALLFAGCEESGEPVRNQSSLACDHFRNVLQDASDGVLTGPELRAKLKEVEGNANIATPGVQSAARQLLAAATGGSSAEVQGAAAQMLAACKVAGS